MDDSIKRRKRGLSGRDHSRPSGSNVNSPPPGNPSGLKPGGSGETRCVRVIQEKGCRVELDLSTQVLGLTVPEETVRSEAEAGEAPLVPWLGELEDAGAFRVKCTTK